MDVSFNIGGAAGQGIDTIGDLLAQVFVKAGFYTFTIKDYRSRVRGGYNFTQIRVSDKPVHVHNDEIDAVIALTKDAVVNRREYLKENGVIIFDKSIGVDEPDQCHFSVPLEEIAREVGGSDKMMNVAALGALLSLLNSPLHLAGEVISDIFKKKGEKIVESNLDVARAAYDYTKDYFDRECTENMAELQKGPSQDKLLITGNQGIALGALAANLKWISSYPMSPSTSVFVEIVKHAKRFKVAAMQSEDEIAGLCMAIGASFVGARSMVTTSGGGFSLMVESLGLSAMSETPVVIYNAQRPGPSTGLPTRTEQGDLLFMTFASQGEFPRVILAPRDPTEAFYLTARAFNLADKFQVPVMILGDQHLADSVKNVGRFNGSEISIDRGKLAESLGHDYKRHVFTDDGISPRAFPGQEGITVVSTGNTHDEAGHISEDPENRNKMVEKRFKKLPMILEALQPPVYFGPSDAPITLLSWGSTWGAVREMVETQSESRYRQLHFSDIYPLRTDELRSVFEESEAVIAVEQNATGQFANLVQMETGLSVAHRVTKYDGRPMSPQWLRSTLKEAGF